MHRDPKPTEYNTPVLISVSYTAVVHHLIPEAKSIKRSMSLPTTLLLRKDTPAQRKRKGGGELYQLLAAQLTYENSLKKLSLFTAPAQTWITTGALSTLKHLVAIQKKEREISKTHKASENHSSSPGKSPYVSQMGAQFKDP